MAPAETELRRGEVLRIIQRNPSGEIVPADQTYLTQLVTRQTGLPEADAKTRVDTVVSEYRNAVTKAQEAAEKARKFALLLAFALAALWRSVPGLPGGRRCKAASIATRNSICGPISGGVSRPVSGRS